MRSGILWRVRQGWYSAAGLAPELARAARVGGVATCATALVGLGLWVHPRSKTHLHVAVRPTACQLRSSRDSRMRLGDEDVVIHWTLGAQPSRLLKSPVDSLLDDAACADAELVAARANSLLHELPRFRDEWPVHLLRFPERLHPALALVDGVCESGGEFLFWMRIGRLRARIRRQVWIPGVGRVDFLLGERLIIEIDGFEHHGSRDEFEADRGRDATVSIAGHRSLRFSQRMVLERWPLVEAAVYAAIARGDHL